MNTEKQYLSIHDPILKQLYWMERHGQRISLFSERGALEEYINDEEEYKRVLNEMSKNDKCS